MDFCPNLNGCRTPIENYNDRPYVFEAGEARFRFDIPNGKDAWIVSIMPCLRVKCLILKSKKYWNYSVLLVKRTIK